MDIVQRIINKDIDDGSKIIRLYAVVMLNYRQVLGDKAWEAMREITGNDSVFHGYVFILGFNLGVEMGDFKAERFRELIQDELGEEQ